MPELLDPTAPPRFAFAALETEVTAAAQGPLRCRLRGRASDGRLLLFDCIGGELRRDLPARLTGASVEATDTAAGRSWRLRAEQGLFEIGMPRVFIHEDVTAQAIVAVPPRAVPLARRLLWRVVFPLLATRLGRRWLQRRAAGA